jgi:hypothetical protein
MLDRLSGRRSNSSAWQRPEASAHIGAGFRAGLAEFGYADGRNASVEYNWLDGQYNRVPPLADLIRRRAHLRHGAESHRRRNSRFTNGEKLSSGHSAIK